MRQTIKDLQIKTAAVLTAATLLSAPALPALIASQTAYAASSSYVTLSSFSGHPAATIVVTGGGFTAKEKTYITVAQGGKTVLSTTDTASSKGELKRTITLPAKLAQGAVTVTARGAVSGKTASNSYYVNPFTPGVTTSANASNPFTAVQVSGTGFAPGETVSITMAGGSATATADTAGAFKAASFVTPYVTAGAYLMTVRGNASGASAVAYQYINGFYPYAAPTDYYVLPLASLGFTGGGFAPNETVTVSDTATNQVVGTFKTDLAGNFKAAGSLVLPASAANSAKSYTLSGNLSKVAVTVDVNVGQYSPQAAPTPYFVQPGASLSFTGSGFAPNETIDVMSGTTKLAIVSADKTGSFKAAGSVTVPLSAAGTSPVYNLVGRASGAAATVSPTVAGFNPQVSPSGFYLQPGASLSFTGSGFGAGETINVLNGTTVVATIKADASGSFKAAGVIKLPYSAANSELAYQLVGTLSGATANAAINVGQLQTSLTPSSFYVLPYTPFSVTASGFAPNEIVTLGFDDAIAAKTTASSLGTATFKNVSVLPSASGSVTAHAVGATSGAAASASLNIGQFNPTVSLSTYYAQPGSSLSLSGNGFAPNETVRISLGGTTQSVVADQAGSFTAATTVPYGATTDSLSVSVSGQTSGAAVSASLGLAPFSASVSPSTYYAQPGSAVSFSGNGFAANETVNISLNGQAIGSLKASAKGSIASGSFTLPYAAGASYRFVGATSGAAASTDVTLAPFNAGLSLDTYYGPAGSAVTLTGSGFAANETVNLQAAGTTIATVKADKTGAFSRALNVPYVAAGSLTFSATGATSGASSSTGYTVAPTYTSVELGSYAVRAGQAVSLIGNGYLANEPITVSSDRLNGSYSLKAGATGLVNDKGLIIPAATEPGELTLTIRGAYSFTTHQITLYVQAADAK